MTAGACAQPRLVESAPRRRDGIALMKGFDPFLKIRIAQGDKARVAIEQRVAPPAEGTATRMPNENVLGQHVPPASCPSPETEIDLLAIAGAKGFGIERPDIRQAIAAEVETQHHADRD